MQVACQLKGHGSYHVHLSYKYVKYVKLGIMFKSKPSVNKLISWILCNRNDCCWTHIFLPAPCICVVRGSKAGWTSWGVACVPCKSLVSSLLYHITSSCYSPLHNACKYEVMYKYGMQAYINSSANDTQSVFRPIPGHHQVCWEFVNVPIRTEADEGTHRGRPGHTWRQMRVHTEAD